MLYRLLEEELVVDSARAGVFDGRQRWWRWMDRGETELHADKTKCRVQEDSNFKSVCECCVIKCDDKFK